MSSTTTSPDPHLLAILSALAVDHPPAAIHVAAHTLAAYPRMWASISELGATFGPRAVADAASEVAVQDVFRRAESVTHVHFVPARPGPRPVPPPPPAAAKAIDQRLLDALAGLISSFSPATVATVAHGLAADAQLRAALTELGDVFGPGLVAASAAAVERMASNMVAQFGPASLLSNRANGD